MSIDVFMQNPELVKGLIEHDREVGVGFKVAGEMVYMAVNAQGEDGHRSVATCAIPSIQGAVVIANSQNDPDWRVQYVLFGTGRNARRIPFDAAKYGSDKFKDILPTLRFGEIAAPEILANLTEVQGEAISDRLRKADEDARIR